MINLLPKENRQQLRAAHANDILIKALIWLGTATAFLILISAATYLLLINERSSQKKITESNTSLSTTFNSAVSDLSKINSNAIEVKSILSQQISYSDAIIQISAALPKNVILENLTLKSHGASEVTLLKVRSKTVNDIATMKANFEKSGLFSNYIETVTNEVTDSSQYPVSIDVSLTIIKGVSL